MKKFVIRDEIYKKVIPLPFYIHMNHLKIIDHMYLRCIIDATFLRNK